jgi:hypothetical protein
MQFLKGIRDVLQEDQPEDNVLVLRSIHMPTKFVSSGPELFFKSEIGTIGLVG